MTPTTLLGAGRLARALAPRLGDAGFPVVWVHARRAAAARTVARAAGARSTTRLARALTDTHLVLLAVSDRAIEPVARRLAGLRDATWGGRVVLHHAGALGPEALAPLADAGASVGVLHPFQCLARPELAERVLAGSLARVDGDPAALRTAKRLARGLGMKPILLDSPAGLDAYHAAAALISNDVVALLDLGLELLERAGLSRRAALDALLSLGRGTLLQAEGHGPRGALTGAAARGDEATLRRHVDALRATDPDGAEAHRRLSRRLRRLARRKA